MYYSLQLTAHLARSESVSRNMIFLIFFLTVGTVAGEVSLSRRMYDSMARLVGEEEYPATWWEEREQCLATISPRLTDRPSLLHSMSRFDPWNCSASTMPFRPKAPCRRLWVP